MFARVSLTRAAAGTGQGLQKSAQPEKNKPASHEHPMPNLGGLSVRSGSRTAANAAQARPVRALDGTGYGGPCGVWKVHAKAIRRGHGHGQIAVPLTVSGDLARADLTPLYTAGQSKRAVLSCQCAMPRTTAPWLHSRTAVGWLCVLMLLCAAWGDAAPTAAANKAAAHRLTWTCTQKLNFQSCLRTVGLESMVCLRRGSNQRCHALTPCNAARDAVKSLFRSEQYTRNRLHGSSFCTYALPVPVHSTPHLCSARPFALPRHAKERSRGLANTGVLHLHVHSRAASAVSQRGHASRLARSQK